jgi:hypothetical protein
MGLTRERTLYVSIFGLAVVGFGVDRFVLSSPDGAAKASDLLVASTEAAARLAGISVGQGGTGSTAAPTVSPEAVMAADLARSLRELGMDGSMLASLPESFAVAMPTPVEVAADDAATTPEPVDVGEPPIVTAVLSGARPRAIAGGKPIVVGSAIDGWDVVFVGNARVVFERNGVQLERRVHRLPVQQTASINCNRSE